MLYMGEKVETSLIFNWEEAEADEDVDGDDDEDDARDL